MRLGLNSRRNNSTGLLRSCAIAALGATLTMGCEIGSLLDQTEMGRYQKQPLVVPILNNIDPASEEVNPEFQGATDIRAEDLVSTATDYVIGANDLISVSITDLVGPNIETVKNMRVAESGKISLPLIGQVNALNLTEAQLEVQIQQAYKDANLIQNAQVSVTVLEARNRTFSILGSVPASGEFAIVRSDLRLLDALVLARFDPSQPGVDNIYIVRKNKDANGRPTTPSGGPQTAPAQDLLTPRSQAPQTGAPVAPVKTAAANQPVSLMTQAQDPLMPTDAAPATQPAGAEGRVVQIEGQAVPADGSTPGVAPSMTTPAPEVTATPAPAFEGFNAPAEPSDVRVIKIPLTRVRNGELKYNLVIRPQDLIYVPSPVIGEYYMGGHVARVGVYSLTARKITLKQAVISAGMLDQVAIPWRTQVVRRIQGKDQEIYARVDLRKIFNGEEPDIFLKPDDQIMVGTDWWAPFAATLRGAFRFTYGFGFLYDRNFANETDSN